jgi:hypothetical protein
MRDHISHPYKTLGRNTEFLHGKLKFYIRALKSTARALLVRKAANEVRNTILFLFSKYLGVNKINYLIVTSDKLADNFEGLVICG